jgi:hypothetical protein
MRLVRWNRLSRKLLATVAAFPIFQAVGTCDPTILANLAASTALDVAAQTNVAVFQLIIGGIQQTLLQNFPGANLLQILLGGTRQPFFP